MQTIALHTKRCTRCGVEKPLSAFFKNCTSADGHLSQCKSCQKQVRSAKRVLRLQECTTQASEKSCNFCGQVKQPSNFSKDLNMKDGLSNVCKVCGQAKRAEATAQLIAKGHKQVAEKCCNTCRVTRPVNEFNDDASQSDGKSKTCRSCASRKNKARKPPGSHREIVLKRHGLTLEDFERMSITQGGKCAICGTTTPGGNGKHLAVDHDHITGEVRALLCGHCNQGLGHFKDNPNRLEAAARYLRAHSNKAAAPKQSV